MLSASATRSRDFSESATEGFGVSRMPDSAGIVVALLPAKRRSGMLCVARQSSVISAKVAGRSPY